MTDNKVSPIVDIIESNEVDDSDVIVTLATGVRAKLTPVTASLIAATTSRVTDPEVPMQPNLDKDGRLEPNPSHPAYLVALQKANMDRMSATVDALVMFGVKLLDDIWDKDQEWIEDLQLLGIDLSGYDLGEQRVREFLYKKYLAVDNDIIAAITEVSGVSEEGVKRQERSFRRNKKR